MRLSELEDVVKRKSAALKTSNNRRERAEETAKAETEQAQVAAELARNTLEDARRKGFLLKERAQDAEILVRASRYTKPIGVFLANDVGQHMTVLRLLFRLNRCRSSSVFRDGKPFRRNFDPGQVKSLQRRLEVSEARAAETKRVGEAELAGRVSAHQQDRVALEAAVSAGEKGE